MDVFGRVKRKCISRLSVLNKQGGDIWNSKRKAETCILAAKWSIPTTSLWKYDSHSRKTLNLV